MVTRAQYRINTAQWENVNNNKTEAKNKIMLA
jgi:hypothetical protein